MNLGRSSLLAGVAVVVIASGVVAQSPAASPSPSAPSNAAPSPAASPAPSATPFPWPTIPRERLARDTFPEWPTGKPTATTIDRGIRLDLWLSSTQAAPGDWVQAIVRATNVGRDTAWVRTGDLCSPGTETRVLVDLLAAMPQGVAQSGRAGAFKALALERGITDHFRSPVVIFGREAAGPLVDVWAECTIEPIPQVEPLQPGRTRTERFYWQAVERQTYGRRGQVRPLFPGTVPVTASWAFAGRGDRPSRDRLERWIPPIKATSAVKLTGDGPGTPSIPELLDAALTDPEFGAWVAEHPFEKGWVIWQSHLRAGSYSAYLDRNRYLTPENAPNGALELFVGRQTRTDSPSLHPKAGIYLDPWTGAVIDRWFYDWCADPADCLR
jgi:hypothetical protein